MSESLLEYNKLRIQQAYIKLIAGLKGSPYYRGGVKLERAAMKAATICTAIGADADLYVEAMYKKYKDAGFYMTHLHTVQAEQIYKEYVSQRKLVDKVELPAHFAEQKRCLARALQNTTREPEDILMDPSIDFSAWFRVYITTQPVERIIAKYGALAKHQVLVNESVQALLAANKLDTHRLDHI